ncbi:MAG: glutamine-hydrolyzing carbamoyl-phosphate synthase small subunit [Chloroflexi bacterium]|nr:glutamine-hydrolyzing carbamoyl-phosphate synthase small subunit [Chloroflexota bacterium]
MTEAALALEDGSVFIGEAFGAPVEVAAEVVFNTGITGYQEVTTDPSYRGQMVVMTHPQIGNYGISRAGDESVRPWVSALIVRELAEYPHHWASESRLEDFLHTWGVPGLQGIDTRALVRRLRETGTQRGVLRQSAGGFSPADLQDLRAAARQAPSVSQLDLVTGVSKVLPLTSSEDDIALIDLGAKWNIIRSLEHRHITPRVWKWDTSATEILERHPRGILVSNGPGDPAKLDTVVATLKELVGSGTPLIGICLGHQLLGLAAGAETNRLLYGHHGGNHPVRDLATGRVTITTQNHEFQVVGPSLPAESGFEVSHVNLNDNSVEGLRHRELPVFSVQYHPEGCPGPQDSQPLFDDFLDLTRVEPTPPPLGDRGEGAGARGADPL